MTVKYVFKYGVYFPQILFKIEQQFCFFKYLSVPVTHQMPNARMTNLFFSSEKSAFNEMLFKVNTY